MNTITLEKAQATLPQLVKDVVDNFDQTVINTEDGEAVVLLSLDEFNAWQETMYLLSTPANAAHLAQSIAEDRANQYQTQSLIDE